jgi:spore germination protein
MRYFVRRLMALTLVGGALVGVGFVGYRLGVGSAGHSVLRPETWRAAFNLPRDTAPPATGFWLTGWHVNYDADSTAVVARESEELDQVILFGWGFDPNGNVTGEDPFPIKGIIGPKKRILLFGNFQSDGFDPDLANAILGDQAVGQRAIAGILAKVREYGGSGVQIDFEGVYLSDREAYSAWLGRLAEALHKEGLTLSVAVPAKQSDNRNGFGGEIDYPAIGRVADYIYLMAYDRHYLGGEPGPVAPLDWTEAVVRYAVGVIPAQKLILGVPLYGYEWGDDPAKNASYGGAFLTSRVAEAGAQAVWDPQAAEYRAEWQSPEGKRVAWWGDERTLEAKLRLAYQYNLKGIALWRLGLEPDRWWPALHSFKQAPSK